MLRKYTSSFLSLPGKVAWQVQSVLSKIALCRTEALGGRLYECPGCHTRTAVYNSCGERHCPQCSGARRADWTERSSQLVLPGINYFQVIFTIPDRLSHLVLGNRRELYRLLMRSAWRAVRHEMKKQNIDPAALLVLHTWNQELQHHPHIHALIPGGGPSANSDNDTCWITARDLTRPWRNKKPSLVDNVALGRTFRDRFVRGLGWLIRNDKLKLTDQWRQLDDTKVLRQWLRSLKQTDWNVFIEGPPHGKSDPLQVLKYLTRYMTGGPISDQRIESDDQGMVTFTARSTSKQKSKNKQPRRIKVPGAEFVRRWSLHVLPKSFTRSRSYGGFHGSRRNNYLETCRQLLPVEPDAGPPEGLAPRPATSKSPTCPRCQIEMQCIANIARPSWRVLLGDGYNQNRRRNDSRHGRSIDKPPNRPTTGQALRPHLPRPDD